MPQVPKQDPIGALLRSRKFLLLCLDAIVSLVLATTTWYLTEQNALAVAAIITIIQPVFIAVIHGITTEDAAEKAARR
jgi:drug/metabolite transporter (DMT)-like permease